MLCRGLKICQSYNYYYYYPWNVIIDNFRASQSCEMNLILEEHVMFIQENNYSFKFFVYFIILCTRTNRRYNQYNMSYIYSCRGEAEVKEDGLRYGRRSYGRRCCEGDCSIYHFTGIHQKKTKNSCCHDLVCSNCSSSFGCFRFVGYHQEAV